jgi:hypothetical protein
VPSRPEKIIFAGMRTAGVRGVLVYCSDYRCSHSLTLIADEWRDDLRLSDLEPRFICAACGKRGADVRPDFSWKGKPVAMIAAPEMEILLIKQLMVMPANSTAPDINAALRGLARLSMKMSYVETAVKIDKK